MSTSSRLLTRTFLVGVLIVSTTVGASALTVKRTNKLIDGAYVPVLIVRTGGETYIHQVGEDGLTRAIMFDRDRALEWARAKYGADVADANGGGRDDDDRDDGGDDDDGGGTF